VIRASSNVGCVVDAMSGGVTGVIRRASET
jgi:hypothetical protein